MEHNEELKNLREEYLRLKEKLDELSKKDLDYVTNENTMLKELHERVFDAGTYTKLDYEYADKYFKDTFDEWKKDGLCTAVCKVTKDGTMMVGRNMDLTICNKAAYVMRTAVTGHYKTVGLAFTFRSVSPDYEQVIKEGITPHFRKVLPFLCDDVLNEKGLYVEINMRNGETWPTGDSKFGCSGTNPESKRRVYLFELVRYIGEHCATVDEAIEYVKTLDIYSMYGHEIHSDNYCFMIADATGHYGVMEFAQNRMIWHDYQQAQANFYLDKDLYAIQTLKAGIGRYNTVMEGIGKVETKEDMLNLMNKVTYFQTYFPDKCQFDNRSEFVGFIPFWTFDYLMNEIKEEEFKVMIGYVQKFIENSSTKDLRDLGILWQSIFTEIVDCNARKLFVRFYEDDTKTLELSLDD